MNYLFDASAIFSLIRLNRIEPLSGGFTTELARYELGNVVWKEHKLQRRLDAKTSGQVLTATKRVLATMKMLELNCHEEEVEKLGNRLGISFYDASYAIHARIMNVAMITDDRRLAKKLEGYVQTINSEALLHTIPV